MDPQTRRGDRVKYSRPCQTHEWWKSRVNGQEPNHALYLNLTSQFSASQVKIIMGRYFLRVLRDILVLFCGLVRFYQHLTERFQFLWASHLFSEQWKLDNVEEFVV